jgi:hypothetical protein
LQANGEAGFEKRAQYYTAKTYIQQREKGIEYKNLKDFSFSFRGLSKCSKEISPAERLWKIRSFLKRILRAFKP